MHSHNDDGYKWKTPIDRCHYVWRTCTVVFWMLLSHLRPHLIPCKGGGGGVGEGGYSFHLTFINGLITSFCFSPPLFIAVSAPSQESERSCICVEQANVFVSFCYFSITFLELFGQCGMFLFFILYLCPRDFCEGSNV